MVCPLAYDAASFLAGVTLPADGARWCGGVSMTSGKTAPDDGSVDYRITLANGRTFLA